MFEQYICVYTVFGKTVLIRTFDIVRWVWWREFFIWTFQPCWSSSAVLKYTLILSSHFHGNRRVTLLVLNWTHQGLWQFPEWYTTCTDSCHHRWGIKSVCVCVWSYYFLVQCVSLWWPIHTTCNGTSLESQIYSSVFQKGWPCKTLQWLCLNNIFVPLSGLKTRASPNLQATVAIMCSVSSLLLGPVHMHCVRSGCCHHNWHC